MLYRKLHQYLIVLGLLYLSAAQAGPQSNVIFEGAPKDSKGRYTNTNSDLSHGSTMTRAKFLARRLATAWRANAGVPPFEPNNGLFLRENIDTPSITWVGHSTFLVQMDGINFLTDPIWSTTASPIPPLGPRRFVKPGVSLVDLPPIDFVVISHNHYDHMDLPTLRKLQQLNPDVLFFVPKGNGSVLRRNHISHIRELDWGENVSFKEVDVYCLPAQHWSKRSLTDTRKALWASWAIIGASRRFYFAGDTGYFNGFKAIGRYLGPFDLAAMPIGAYEPNEMMQAFHMNPEEAVQAALDIEAKLTVAMHFGTFDLSDEPMNDPPLRFKKAAQKKGMGKDTGWVLAIGETRQF